MLTHLAEIFWQCATKPKLPRPSLASSALSWASRRLCTPGVDGHAEFYQQVRPLGQTQSYQLEIMPTSETSEASLRDIVIKDRGFKRHGLRQRADDDSESDSQRTAKSSSVDPHDVGNMSGETRTQEPAQRKRNPGDRKQVHRSH